MEIHTPCSEVIRRGVVLYLQQNQLYLIATRFEKALLLNVEIV